MKILHKEFWVKNKKKVIAIAIAAVLLVPAAIVFGVNKFKSDDEVVDAIGNDEFANENEVLETVVEETTTEEA